VNPQGTSERLSLKRPIGRRDPAVSSGVGAARLSAFLGAHESRNCRVGGASATGAAKRCRRSEPSSTDMSQLMAEVPADLPGRSHTSVFVSLAYGTLIDADRWSTLAMYSRS
jgi:hypothetical protein